MPKKHFFSYEAQINTTLLTASEKLTFNRNLTRSKNRIPSLPSDHVPHLLQHNILHKDEDRSDLVGEHVGVGCGGQPLPSQRDDVQTAGELVEEVGVTWGRDDGCEFGQRAGGQGEMETPLSYKLRRGWCRFGNLGLNFTN